MAVIHLGVPALILLIQGELRLSRTEVGLLSDRLFGNRRKSTLLLVGFLAILMTLWTSLFSPQTPHWLVWVVVALLGLTLLGWNGLI